MAGFLIAMISGALMSLQGVFNTQITKSGGMWPSMCFVQFSAFVTSVIAWLFCGRQRLLAVFDTQPRIALFGGVIGAFITFTVVKAVGSLGVANAEIIIVVTQIGVAYIIGLFGLFGSEKDTFSWVKLLGMSVAILGVIIFSVSGQKTS